MSPGIDIIEIKRIEKVFQKYGQRFLERFLTAEEIQNIPSRYPARYLAGRWAVKEALIKASGKIISWKDIAILRAAEGAPQVVLKGKNATNIKVSLSHSRDYAIAVAIIE